MPSYRPLRKRTPAVRLRTRGLYGGGGDGLGPVRLRPGMNEPESRIAQALDDLNIFYIAQQSVLGGSYLGGAKLDFALPQYMVDLEYQGPFHFTTEGSGRDVLRNLGVTAEGYTVVKLYERDLRRLKPRILEIIGNPVGAGVGQSIGA